MEKIVNPQSIKGIIFVVDSASLSTSGGKFEDEKLRETAEYLHDILLLLKKRATSSKSSKPPAEIHVLVAANKSDLFTALPASLVESTLEEEITKIIDSRAKGLLDSGIGVGDGFYDEKDMLGEEGMEFEFYHMKEFNIFINVSAGNVVGSNGPDVNMWWYWIGALL